VAKFCLPEIGYKFLIQTESGKDLPSAFFLFSFRDFDIYIALAADSFNL
jgi:hypothetical protein